MALSPALQKIIDTILGVENMLQSHWSGANNIPTALNNTSPTLDDGSPNPHYSPTAANDAFTAYTGGQNPFLAAFKGAGFTSAPMAGLSAADRQSVYDAVLAGMPQNDMLRHMFTSWVASHGGMAGGGGAEGLRDPYQLPPGDQFPPFHQPPEGPLPPNHEPPIGPLPPSHKGPVGVNSNFGSEPMDPAQHLRDLLSQGGLRAAPDLWTQRRSGFPAGHPLSRLMRARGPASRAPY